MTWGLWTILKTLHGENRWYLDAVATHVTSPVAVRNSVVLAENNRRLLELAVRLVPHPAYSTEEVSRSSNPRFGRKNRLWRKLT